MKSPIAKNTFKTLKLTLLFCFLALLLHSCISSYIGYNGYEKWKYRRSTFGDRTESIERNVFTKELKYISSVKLDSFDVFIEKGYKYGYKRMTDTRLVTGSKYPFQISLTGVIPLDNINYYLVNSSQFDSIDNLTIYLEENFLKDTVLVGIHKYTTQWDSIGFIKIWDSDKNSADFK